MISPLTRARKRGTPDRKRLDLWEEPLVLLTETGGHQVEQGGLGVLVDVHHEDRQEKSGKVS